MTADSSAIVRPGAKYTLHNNTQYQVYLLSIGYQQTRQKHLYSQDNSHRSIHQETDEPDVAQQWLRIAVAKLT